MINHLMRSRSTADLKRIEKGRQKYLSELFEELESMDAAAPENADRIRELSALISEYESYCQAHQEEMDRRSMEAK